MKKIALWILSAFLICGCSQQSSKKEEEPALEETETPAAQETEDPAEAAVFDPRPDAVSKVRKQEWGICWAMAGISTMESALIRHGFTDNQFQLSTEDLLWWANVNDEGGWNSRRRSDGGYTYMCSGYLTTRGVRSLADIPDLGPAEEDDAESDYYGQGINQRPEKYDTARELYEADGIAFYPHPSREEIREAIAKYGAVSTGYWESPDYLNEEKSCVWHPYEPDSGTNHNISVVGWDDTFSKDNFIPSPDGRKPEHDGAWLIKNSFGTDYANEGGFLYVSYEDAYLFTEEENPAFAVTSIIEPDGLKRYMLDDFGAVNLIEIKKDVFEEAAVYEFTADETAERIAFTAGGKGTSFSVYYAPAAEGKPSEDQNEWKLLKSGTLDYTGYHTFEIEPLEIKEGEGALILHLEGNDIIIGIEEALTKTGGKPKYFEVLSGRSFMKEENGFISCERDLDENGMAVKHGYDVSLRIFTDGE